MLGPRSRGRDTCPMGQGDQLWGAGLGGGGAYCCTAIPLPSLLSQTICCILCTGRVLALGVTVVMKGATSLP